MAESEKSAYLKELSNLFNLAINVQVDEFLQLVKDVTELLDHEGGRVGSLEIRGKLVSIPSMGQAIVVGDIHGDLQSLRYVIKNSGFLQKVRKDKDVFIIYLGDYGDRGPHSPEVYYVVLKLKQLFPEHVVLMRGNHEGPSDLLAYPHDLPTHLHRKFGNSSTEVYTKLREFFDHLYTAVLVEGKYIMLHGGVPSQASTIEDLAYAHEKHPRERHMEEILWSDPHEGIKETLTSPRGAGRLFGEGVTDKLLEMLHIKVIIRGHEPSDEGFKINHDGKVLTIFSRRGPPYQNSYGAYLKLDLSEEVENVRHIVKYVHKF